MVRVIKEEKHSARRNEILDAALKLVYSKGYGKMTIQDILDQLRISKGAFYHYFDSKATVLEALVERMVNEQVIPMLPSIVEDPHPTALEKLQRYFEISVRWKTDNKALMLELIKVWYSDENALARNKMMTRMDKQVTPLLAEIIKQGVREGTFTTPYPEFTSLAIINLILPLGNTFAQMLLSEDVAHKDSLQQAQTLIAAGNDALERVLGAPQGSIHLMDTKALKEWFPPDETPAVQSKPIFEQIGVPATDSP